jgi:guanylate kinase
VRSSERRSFRPSRAREGGREAPIGVFVVAGPSGVGKGTLVSSLRRWRPNLVWSVSVTTRAPRPGEVPGIDYLFFDDAAFDELIRNGELLEWAEIFGHRSGTPRAPVEKALREGLDVLLELDIQGARAVKAQLPAAVMIFVAPPSADALKERLARRHTETPNDLARRLARADEELAAASEFDHVVINDDVERAWHEIADIISASGTS